MLAMTFHLCYVHFTMQNEHFNYVEWKRLPRGDVVPHWSGLYVSMNKMGGIVVSGVTHARVGSPEAYCIDHDWAQPPAPTRAGRAWQKGRLPCPHPRPSRRKDHSP